MARMATGAKKRPRRSFTDEFKAGAVRLVLDEGKTRLAGRARPGRGPVGDRELGKAGSG